jgi:predicted DsbA family dithiol-disulfide isomerase
MQVEIWSDVMCPFCYIGKRRFEQALNQFPNQENIHITWKSFQLDPNIQHQNGKHIDQYLADAKGMPLAQAKQLNDQVTKMAAEVGLVYRFDLAVVANSFDAHRFAHLAAKHGLGDDAEEALFNAYFTEGKDISDHETLTRLGLDIGLDPIEVQSVLEGEMYADEVHRDIAEAQNLGIRGVPFFVLDRKYAVSGAQPVETFSGALKQAYAEWSQKEGKPLMDLGDGQVCTPGGECI